MIYADIVRGKLDQKNQQLEVDFAVGRDLRPEQIGDIISVLEEWYALKVSMNILRLCSFPVTAFKKPSAK